MKPMIYVFSSGLKIEGSLEELLTISKALKETLVIDKIVNFYLPEGYHLSSSGGELVLLKSMNVVYLRNALVKRTKTYIDNVRVKTGLTNHQWLMEFQGLTSDPEIVALFNELATRE